MLLIYGPYVIQILRLKSLDELEQQIGILITSIRNSKIYAPTTDCVPYRIARKNLYCPGGCEHHLACQTAREFIFYRSAFLQCCEHLNWKDQGVNFLTANGKDYIYSVDFDTKVTFGVLNSKLQLSALLIGFCCSVITINVSVVYMGPDVVLWMPATSIMRGVIRGGH